MPSEEHIDRQVRWRTKLQKYGCEVNLERTVYIRGAKVVVDVYAEVEGKTFLIEIGDINDERKTALIQYYAEDNPKIEFIHEDYGENKIPQVLESITAYRNSPEYKHLAHQRMLLEQQRKKAKIDDRRNKRYSLFTILIVWLVPSVALMAFDDIIALGWFAFGFMLLFVFPFMLFFLGEYAPLGYIFELFGSLNKPMEEKSMEETETKSAREREHKDKFEDETQEYEDDEDEDLLLFQEEF